MGKCKDCRVSVGNVGTDCLYDGLCADCRIHQLQAENEKLKKLVEQGQIAVSESLQMPRDKVMESSLQVPSKSMLVWTEMLKESEEK